MPTTGAIGLPSVENRLDLLALKPVLRPAKIAGNDRIIHRRGKAFTIAFSHMGEGAVEEQIAFFVYQFGRHRRQPSAVEKVHEKGFKDVIPMMPQHHGGAAFLPRDPVEIAPAQTAAKGAEGASGGDLVHHD